MENKKFIGDYYILHIDVIKKMVEIRIYNKNDFEKASSDYVNIEKSIENSENAVVLVSSDSIKSLKKAYPSYFLDTSEFISALERIISNCEKLRRKENLKS